MHSKGLVSVALPIQMFKASFGSQFAVMGWVSGTGSQDALVAERPMRRRVVWCGMNFVWLWFGLDLVQDVRCACGLVRRGLGVAAVRALLETLLGSVVVAVHWFGRLWGRSVRLALVAFGLAVVVPLGTCRATG